MGPPMDRLDLPFLDRWRAGGDRGRSPEQQTPAALRSPEQKTPAAVPLLRSLGLEQIAGGADTGGPRQKRGWQLFTDASTPDQSAGGTSGGQRRVTTKGAHALQPSVRLEADAAGTPEKLDALSLRVTKHFRGRQVDGDVALNAASNLSQPPQLAVEGQIKDWQRGARVAAIFSTNFRAAPAWGAGGSIKLAPAGEWFTRLSSQGATTMWLLQWVRRIGGRTVVSPAWAVSSAGDSEVALRWTHQLATAGGDSNGRKEVQVRASCNPKKSLLVEGRALFGEVD